MYTISTSFPDDLMFEKNGPRITIYQPTHKSLMENKKDPIMFKSHIREAETIGKDKYEPDVIRKITGNLYELEKDRDFWDNSLNSIAVFADADHCIVYRLQTKIKDFTAFDNNFYIRPLIKAHQSIGKFLIIGLNKTSFSLYQGSKYEFNEIELSPDIMRTLDEVLGEEQPGLNPSHSSHRGTGVGSMFYGRGDATKDIENEEDKYFRYVDRVVYDNYSKHLKCPVILAALGEHQTEFKKLSHNPYLSKEGITTSFDTRDLAQIKKAAIAMMDKTEKDKEKEYINKYSNAKALNLGTAYIEDIIKAAYENRIDCILIEEGRVVNGVVNNNTDELQTTEQKLISENDILEGIIDLVIKAKGNVVVLPPELMPDNSGAAAVLRY